MIVIRSRKICLGISVAIACGSFALTACAVTIKPSTDVSPQLMMECNGGGDPDPFYGGYSIHDIRRSTSTALPSQIRVYNDRAVASKLGVTPAAIQKNFSSVIESNLANGPTEQIIALLSDKELAAIASKYQASVGARKTPLLKTFASRLSDVSLLRVASAFDRTAVQEAVNSYSSASVKSSFSSKASFVTPMMLPPPGGDDPGGGGSGGGSGGSGGSGGGASPAPTTDMTLEDIYLEFRTAPVGSLSAPSALSETAIFAASRLVPAAAAGTAIGTGISYLIQNYDPSLDDAIGGTIAASLDNFQAAGSDIEQGHYESAYDDMFGYPLTNSFAPLGDWEVSSYMVDYYSSGGGCGW